MTPRLPRLVSAAAAGLCLLTAGCQNPFDPKADVRMWRFSTGNVGGVVATIEQAKATTTEQAAFSASQNVEMWILNYGSVPYEFDSYTVVYRQADVQKTFCNQPAGAPICTLGGPGGRRFPITIHAGSLLNVNSMDATSMQIAIRPMTKEMYDYIGSNSETLNGGLDLDITLNGTDHNGHDIKVTGTLHVEVY